MSREEVGQENTRKIQKTGEDGGSYMVTLPKSIMNKLGWREHQKVVVTEENGVITIKDWEA